MEKNKIATLFEMAEKAVVENGRKLSDKTAIVFVVNVIVFSLRKCSELNLTREPSNIFK